MRLIPDEKVVLPTTRLPNTVVYDCFICGGLYTLSQIDLHVMDVHKMKLEKAGENWECRVRVLK